MAVDTSREAVEALIGKIENNIAVRMPDPHIAADTIRTLLSERDAERAAKEKAIKERDKARAFALTPSRRKVRKPTMDVTA